MTGWIMPKDVTSNKAMCIAYVNYDQQSIKVLDLIWVNRKLGWIKKGWEMLGSKGLIYDIENNFYRQGDIYSAQGLVYDIFESGLIK